MDIADSAPAVTQSSKAAMNKPKPISALCAVHNPQGVIAHWTKPGQIVAWNMVGQVAFGETLNVTILTPYTPPPKEHERIAIKSRPPPPATAIVVHEETEEAPSIPPEFDRIPCWIDRFSVDTQRDPELQLEMSQLLLKLKEPSMLFGPKDPGVKAIAWSPKGLSPLGGCLMAVLETNLNLTIRGTEKDHIQGQWEKTCQLSEESYKLNKGGKDTSNFDLATDLLFQCIAWSNAPILPSPWGARPHDSLLAVGSRLGSIALWHLNPKRKWIRVWRKVVIDQWITELVWSDWKTIGPSTASNELAFTTDNGSVYTVGVQLQFGDDGNHSDILVEKPRMHSSSNNYAITGLRYAHGQLVCTRTGAVQIFSQDKSRIEEIRLPKIGNWPSCSPYSPCNGIGALPDGRILISLYSGEQHVIRFEQGKPILDPEATVKLSKGMRRSIEEAEFNDDEGLSRKAPRITGFTLAPSTVGDKGSTLFACMLEPANLQDFDFPKDNNRKHLLILGNLATDYFNAAEEQGPDMGSNSRDSAKQHYAALQTASSILLPFLPNILPSDTLAKLNRTSLYLPSTAPSSDAPSIPTTREKLLAQLKYSWMDSEKAKLFQLGNVWRMWNESQTNYDPASNPFAAMTGCSPMEVLLEPLFVYLAGVCSLPGADQAANIDTILRMLRLDGGGQPTESIQKYGRLLKDYLPEGTNIIERTDESCVICSGNIPFVVDLSKVVPDMCLKKHVWGRCSVTYRLITTPFSRTCSTCYSKSLIPKPHTQSTMWSIEQDLLSIATSCPRCGGVWRSVV